MDWNPQTHGERIFVVSASFWALVLASAYTANLASFLVVVNQPNIVALDLNEAVLRQIPVCVREAAVAGLLRAKYPKLNLVVAPDFKQTYGNLMSGKCKLLATRSADFQWFERDKSINGDCSLEWVGRADEIIWGGAATIVDTGLYCTSMVSHVLDIHFAEMMGDEFILNAMEDHLRYLSTHSCDDIDRNERSTEGYSLKPNDVGGIFVFHGILAFVAVVAAWFERKSVLKKCAGRIPLEMKSPQTAALTNYRTLSIKESTRNLQSSGREGKLTSAANEHGPKKAIFAGNTTNSGEFDDNEDQELRMMANAVAMLQTCLSKKRSRRQSSSMEEHPAFPINNEEIVSDDVISETEDL